MYSNKSARRKARLGRVPPSTYIVKKSIVNKKYRFSDRSPRQKKVSKREETDKIIELIKTLTPTKNRMNQQEDERALSTYYFRPLKLCSPPT